MSPDKVVPRVDTRIRLRKRHACGGDVFRVAAVGADVRLFCEGCGAKIFVDRAEFPRRVREVLDVSADEALGG
jgi:hypothetical protein